MNIDKKLTLLLALWILDKIIMIFLKKSSINLKLLYKTSNLGILEFPLYLFLKYIGTSLHFKPDL